MPQVLRVSSLIVTPDLPAACAQYADLGFTRVATDDKGCVGYVVGETGVILVDADFAARCWGRGAANGLLGRCVPYVFVQAIDSVDHERVLADVRTWFGMREVLVDTVSGPVVLAEMAA